MQREPVSSEGAPISYGPFPRPSVAWAVGIAIAVAVAAALGWIAGRWIELRCERGGRCEARTGTLLVVPTWSERFRLGEVTAVEHRTYAVRSERYGVVDVRLADGRRLQVMNTGRDRSEGLARALDAARANGLPRELEEVGYPRAGLFIPASLSLLVALVLLSLVLRHVWRVSVAFDAETRSLIVRAHRFVRADTRRVVPLDGATHVRVDVGPIRPPTLKERDPPIGRRLVLVTHGRDERPLTEERFGGDDALHQRAAAALRDRLGLA